MTNRGVAPLLPDTEVGQLRALVGDVEYTPFDPPDPGFGQYQYFADVELAAFIRAADGSLLRAEGLALHGIAKQLTILAVDVQTDDLRSRTIEKAKLMRELANDKIAQADTEDEKAVADIFEIVPFGGRRASAGWAPEGMAGPRHY